MSKSVLLRLAAILILASVLATAGWGSESGPMLHIADPKQDTVSPGKRSEDRSRFGPIAMDMEARG